MKLMIFSGTTEGHGLCRFLSKNNVQAEVFVATEYGAAVMEPMAGITVHEGRLDEREMEKRLTSDTLLIDATHPYAAAVTDNLRAACAKSGARYERLLRPALPYQNCEIVLDTAAAVVWLNAHPGKVLLTTGSKELEAYTAVQDFQTRLFPRVLPTASVLEKCAALGFPGAHIIAMQGPFSQAMNAALLREIGAKILVTKDTGASGGFAEKVAAAEEVGATVLVIARPREEQGRNQVEMQRFLTDLLGLQPEKVQRTFTIIGAGMGTMDTLTGEAVRALETAEAVFATKRLAVLSPKAEVCAFSELAEQAIQCTEKHISLLVSGDVGIDMIAGPSEVCVVADETADPALVAIDLMAQAEHDPLASCYLVTFSAEYADAVEAAVAEHMKDSTRADITTASLDNEGLVVVCNDRAQALQAVNVIAPEHLELHIKNPQEALGKIRHAGAIFMGEWTPEAVGDYVAGPNHTLPTGGTARFSSPLSVDEFIKKSSVIQYSPEALSQDGEAVVVIAQREGLWAPAHSVELRLAAIASSSEA